MMFAKWHRAGALACLVAAVALSGCHARLPRSVRDQIRSERDQIQSAERQLDRSAKTVRSDLAQAPDLFQGTPVAADWPARLRSDREKLESAKSDDRELERLARQDRADAASRAEWLLTSERNLRESALRDAGEVERDAEKWLAFRRNLPSSVENMKREYDDVRAVDLSSTDKAVAKAEHDWPTKKTDLESRLAALKAVPEKAAKEWQDTDAARKDALAGKAGGAEVATLIEADDVLSRDAAGLPRQAGELRDECSQLYNSWDKILTDLDVARQGPEQSYREQIKTVLTHFDDASATKGQTNSDQKWVEVSQPQFRAVENDLGMSIAHKDAGKFDSEAQTVPQPAGFAYIAPPAQGSNQYGYWSHDPYGHSVWTWLPAYFIMRDMLWAHNYRPVMADEYNTYHTFARGGRTFYGQTSPSAPPVYGSHGTFTEKRYANSHYVQSGGFKGSTYASRQGSPAVSHMEPRVGANEPGGHRFGSGASGSAPSGRRFGSGASHMPPSRGFGYPRGMRSPGRSFGRRR